jgi:hypothetical protein
MSRLLFKLLATVIVLRMTTAAFALDVPLTYVRHPDEGDSFRPFSFAQANVTIERPAGDWNLPELKSKTPLYALAEFGDKELLLILDRQNADDFFYNRLYLDSNGNKDLTDDPVIEGTFDGEEGDYCHTLFPSVDITIELKGESLPYSFRAYVSYTYFGDYGRPDQELKKEHIDENLSFILRSNCFYSGRFELDGRVYRVALGDSNVNGRFNDRFPAKGSPLEELVRAHARSPVLSGNDHFYLAAERLPEFGDAQVCGDLLLVSGELFEVSISTAESKLTLTPTGEKLFPVNLPMATKRITLYTNEGVHCVMMYRPGTKIALPAGEHRLLDYAVTRKDGQGDEWLLEAVATNDSAPVAVDAGSRSALRFGEPYVPVVEVPPEIRQALRDGNVTDVPLLFAVTGASKEIVTDLARISGDRTRIPLSTSSGFGNRPKEPTYKIVQPDGQIVAQGSFEYG